MNKLSHADAGILYLTLYKKWFVEILEGRKRVEYRQRTARYDKMFTMREYTHAKFVNGYGKNRPWMLVEIKRLEKTEGQWLIHLGDVVDSGNLHLLGDPDLVPEEFGYVGHNDWPLCVHAKYKLYGYAEELWCAEQIAKGKPQAAWFCGLGKARSELARLYKQYGH